MLIDEVLPAFEFHEVHTIEIRAGAAEVYEATRAVTPAEMPLVGLFFRLRALPGRLLGRGISLPLAGKQPILDQALHGGFVLLGEIPEREIVIGTVGVFWSLRGGPSPVVENAKQFMAFDQPGYARAVMNFSIESRSGIVWLRTETRIRPTDPESRVKFRRYWRFVHPGSALIRHLWLRAIKRRAERM